MEPKTIEITLASAMCPICGDEESVKGFKVQDGKRRWWSYCFADHTGVPEWSEFPEHLPTGKTRDDCLWFTWVDEETVLIEGPDSHKVLECKIS